MPHPYPHPSWLADEITRQLGQLANQLAHTPAREATQLLARILNPDGGILAGVNHLVATGSTFAKDQAERGALPPEVWLALGRASNELDAIGGDLDEHRETLRSVATQPATTTSIAPAPVPLVVRRHR
ncbi:hypothetical protein [Streptomyces sp. NPDC096323]|uniref:hypothetical protein n=1 Tax=Streptomyces sp. NPDC096323 TaxID=3155822 RepID=UPI00332937BF